MNYIHYGDNLEVLKGIGDESIPLVYIDPPFNTGKIQNRTQVKSWRSESGGRTGFHGHRYRTQKVATIRYTDLFEDYYEFLEPRLVEAYRVLSATGTLYFHTDYREVHYCKILLDKLFGRSSFLNEVIWAYDYGGRPKNRWPPKHDNILVYVKDPEKYTFNYDEIQKIPYMAPDLVGPEKATRGKLPTDTWWHTIVPTSGTEKTGYPTQKPVGILKRIIQASSKPGEVVLDFFAGSGTTGMAALSLGREFIMVDSNIDAMKVMALRFSRYRDIEWVGFDATAVPGPDRQDEAPSMSAREGS